MKIIKYLFLVFLIFFTKQSFWYQELVKEEYEWKQTQYIKVVIDENHSVVTVISNSWDTLKNLVKSVWWISWVNWAYFCPADYKQCSWINYSENTRYVEWVRYSKYFDDLWISWLFWFDKDWKPLFILKNEGYVEGINRRHNVEKLKDMNYWIANFPVLLLEWKNVINESKDILDIKQKTKWIKSFICSLDDNKTIKMWTVSNVTVEELALYIQTNLNCHNAINLDSGWSLWMLYNDKEIKTPWRKIMDAFVVIEKKATEKTKNEEDIKNTQKKDNNKSELEEKNKNLEKIFQNIDKNIKNDPKMKKKVTYKICCNEI